MPVYAALLRGVSPMNAKMPALRAALEAAGFTDVATVLASGNVVFRARKATNEALQRKVEAAMTTHMDRSFATIVRPVETLREMLSEDPLAAFDLAPKAKRIVTFLRDDQPGAEMPLGKDGAQLLTRFGQDVLGAYVPSPGDPAFMRLIERSFGKEVTTRTWDTVKKIVRAAPEG